MKKLFLVAIAVLAISQPVLSESQFDDQLEDARKDALRHFAAIYCLTREHGTETHEDTILAATVSAQQWVASHFGSTQREGERVWRKIETEQIYKDMESAAQKRCPQYFQQ